MPETKLLTLGRVAALLGVAVHRVAHIVATRPHIRAAARAGTLRLFDRRAVAMIRHELSAQDARRCRREVARG